MRSFSSISKKDVDLDSKAALAGRYDCERIIQAPQTPLGRWDRLRRIGHWIARLIPTRCIEEEKGGAYIQNTEVSATSGGLMVRGPLWNDPEPELA